MIKREIENDITYWIKNNTKQALLISGARQVGKTYSIRHCLKENKCCFYEINFLTNPNLCKIIDNAHDAKDVVRNLKLLIGNSKVDYIFFDESQECLEILTVIKFLVEDGTFRYILSGSLLGIEMNNLRSAPVGYIQYLDMHPLCLREFFRALETPEDIMQDIKNKKIQKNFIHDNLMQRFYLYLVIGGMPAVAERYLQTNDIRDVRNEQKEILKLYKIDYTKYEKKHKLKLIEFYESIPTQLQSQNIRFKLNNISGIKTYNEAADSFTWLNNAGVVLPVYNILDLTSPLIINEKRNLFKLFLNDVGLLSSYYSDMDILDILNNPESKYLGAPFENFAATQLNHNNYRLRYFNNKKIGEIDFVIEHNNKITPIEIKSGKTVKKHKALLNALNCKNYNIDEAYVFCTNNFEDIGNIHYCPIYSLMFFEEKKINKFKYKIENIY